MFCSMICPMLLMIYKEPEMITKLYKIERRDVGFAILLSNRDHVVSTHTTFEEADEEMARLYWKLNKIKSELNQDKEKFGIYVYNASDLIGTDDNV